jgi:rhodanese-related sulfurtransferase
VAFGGCASDDPDPTENAAAAETTAVDIPAPLSVQEAAEVIATRRGEASFVILDVRTPDEYTTSHIEGAVNINVEDPAFSEQIAELDKGATYVVYCRSGNRSAVATAQMRAAGFTQVSDVAGGLGAWAAAGLPLV